MSLINCTECGKEISDKATSCPNCGAPIEKKKYCKFCAERIDFDCIICPKCGKQVEDIYKRQESIVINNSSNSYSSSNILGYKGNGKNKWVSIILCLFFGVFGGHKFYEGKTGMGIVYIFTFGFLYVGVLIDLIILIFKPNPYYL